MTIEYAILGLLSWRPMTGYDLKKMFTGSTALYWSGNNNQIYSSLVRLHREGSVSLEIQQPAAGPARKVYSITPQGKARLKQWVLAAPEPPQLRHPFLVQLAWADQLDDHELETLLTRYEEEINTQLLLLRSQSKKSRPEYFDAALARTPREACIWEMIQENWQGFYDHEMDWVHRLRKELNLK